MNPIVRNILAVIVGWLSGSIINMGIVSLGHKLFPIEGIDPNDMEALAAAMPNMEFKYLIFPFLAHALGTLVGAAIASYIGVGHKMKLALGVGVIFLIGGIAVNIMIPGPLWFTIIDIIFAYIPMAWIGGSIFSNR